MANPLVSIQILNWNRGEETLRAIDSALNQSYDNIEVVVIDNGSTDGSVDLINRTYPDLLVVSLDRNYGCPGGRNRGIGHCAGDYIFYLDNDGVLHREAVEKAVEIMINHSKCAVVTGVVYDFEEIAEIDVNIRPKSNEQYLYRNFLGGICMHRKSFYNIVGNYPDHFMYGGEEWYLTAMILDNDLQIIKDESVILWHKRSSLARNREKELLNAYYNKLYISISLYPLKYAIAFALYFPLQYSKYAKKEGIVNTYRKTFFKRYATTIRKGLRNRKPISSKTYNILMKGY